MYDATSIAEGYIDTQMGDFSGTVAPIEDESEGLQLALDLLGLGFALFASPIWNSDQSCSALGDHIGSSIP
ncbi:hypothetical protein ABVK25_005688 [Lepraria finkii]|uniref:Uncharacterized protein n=1 Tax=Lepraria finkii TaxID=1340010 RepID=A0ABR4B8H8_9LECA